jgi:broad specificity phosphatase PhoE
MARRIHLLRHAETHNPDHVVYAMLPGFGLTDQGRRQAKQAARYLGSQPVVAVWSSPAERAMETSAIVAGRFGLPVLIDERLREWGLADRWSGICWEDLGERMPGELEAYLEDPTDLPFSPESLAELTARITGAVTSIHGRHPEGDVVVVSHQDPVQAARLAFCGRPPSDLWDDKPRHAEVVTLQPGTPWRELTRWAPEEQGDDPSRSRDADVASDDTL